MPSQEDSIPPTPPRSSATDGDARWHPPSLEELQGMLQGYELIEMIGLGGMGAVYKARQVSLDRMVAIKILPAALWDDAGNYAMRFRNEARMMAKLMHPGMIAVFDFGETPDGQLYFVMEYVEGTDVAQMILKQGLLPPLHALAIAAHVCDTLRYAHEHGIIHHDIKPANVMVDTEGRVKVADFGLAKLTTQDAGQPESTMTMGTPDYVAPESLVQGATVDHRADLFSLGVMLHQMLTGKVPRGDFELPSVEVPGLDKRFDAIIIRSMQAEPDARYQSAAEFRRALDHILAVPVETNKARTRRLRPVPRPAGSPSVGPVRKPVPTGLVAATLVALLAGGAYFYSNRGAPPPNNSDSREEIPSVPADASPATAAPKSPFDGGTPSAGETGATPPSTGSVAAPPMPQVAPPDSTPETDTRRKLRELDSQFQVALDRDVTKVHENAVADLDTKYVAALDRALTAALAAGNLPDSLALREEKQRAESHQEPPGVDPADLPEKLKSFRGTYRVSISKLAADRIKNEQALYSKYEQVLASYQKELTQAGKLDEALEVAAVRNRVSAPSRGTGPDRPKNAGSSGGASGTIAVTTPTAVAALFDSEEPWMGEILIPAKVYRPTHKVVLGRLDKADSNNLQTATVTCPKGTQFEAGEIFIERRSLWKSDGCLFKGTKIGVNLNGQFEASNSIFQQCDLRKEGSWVVNLFSSKWIFDNCVFSKAFTQKPWTKHIGAKVKNCTFYDVDFPQLRYQKDAGEEAPNEWVAMKNCRFVHCKVPESVLITTQECVFEGCEFGKPEDDMVILTPVKAVIYITDRKTAPAAGPRRTIEMLDATAVPKPAGATIRHRKSGDNLSFE